MVECWSRALRTRQTLPPKNPFTAVILSGANVTPDQLILPNVDVPVGNYNYWGRQSYGPPQPPTPVEPCTAYGSIAGYTCYGGYCSSGSAEDDCGQSLAEPALHCNGTQNLQQCAQQAASLCNTTTGCNSFGLSPVYVRESVDQPRIKSSAP